MPRKRRVPKRRRVRLTLRDVGIVAQLEFSVGWHPPTTDFERSRSTWMTFTEYLSDYAAVREEYLARRKSSDTPFAERLYQRAQAEPEADLAALAEQLRDEDYASENTTDCDGVDGAADATKAPG